MESESTILKYNYELQDRFKQLVYDRFNSIEDINQQLDRSESMDYYDALQTYRNNRDVEAFLASFKEFHPQEESVRFLWEAFNSMTDEELADTAIVTIEELLPSAHR